MNLVGLLASLSALVACSNPCDDLSEVCAYCPDQTYRQECRAIVDKQQQTVCSADLVIFRAQCPVPPSSSSIGGATSATVSGAGGQTGPRGASSSSTVSSAMTGAGGGGGAVPGQGGAGGN